MYGVYEFYGIYGARTSGDLLEGGTAINNRMTLAYCASFCEGSVYFAIQNGMPIFLGVLSVLFF